MLQNEIYQNANATQIEFIDLDHTFIKLRKEIHKNEKMTWVLGSIIADAFQKATVKIHQRYSMAYKDARGEYKCILLNHKAFMYEMEQVMAILYKKELKTKNFSFLDVDIDIERFHSHAYSFVDAGCGVGHKVFLAEILGFSKVVGIDIEPEYLSAAKRTIKQFCENKYDEERISKTIKFIKQDILETNYSNFDVIYFYVPFRNHDKEVEFEKRIIETAKSGAIIVGMSNHCLDLATRNKLIKHAYNIYEKK